MKILYRLLTNIATTMPIVKIYTTSNIAFIMIKIIFSMSVKIDRVIETFVNIPFAVDAFLLLKSLSISKNK